MATRHYEGGCHCGAVRYGVDIDLDGAIQCNCSRCRRLGGPLAFAPESRFALKSGEEALKDYLFNKHAIHHLFCTHCGIESFARGTAPDGQTMIAVNVSCLDDVDLDALDPKKVDGKNF
ncbi:MAG: GFA family protein [Methylobacterium mesophilicum]|nr:GFA family protein [Methylobacterium mesophilicum]